MSILQSKRYNPNSIYSANPALARPQTLMRDDTWDARGSMDRERQGAHPDEVEGLQHEYAPHGQGAGQYGYAAQQGQGYASGVDNGGQYDDAANDHRRSAYQYGESDYAPGGAAYGHQQEQEQQAYDHRAYGNGGGGGYVETPPEARYGRDPGPTPELNQYHAGQGVGFAGGAGGLSRPGAVQNHPGKFCFLALKLRLWANDL